MVPRIDRRDRACLLSILAPFADRIDRVGLFGSQATGAARKNSDIDLVIYGSVEDRDIDRLWTMFDDSRLSVSVDVIRYDDAMYPPLRRHIDRSVQTLFDADALHAFKPTTASSDI